jgi:hypothetical protein
MELRYRQTILKVAAKQQAAGSRQLAVSSRQFAVSSRQSAETSRQPSKKFLRLMSAVYHLSSACCLLPS